VKQTAVRYAATSFVETSINDLIHEMEAAGWELLQLIPRLAAGNAAQAAVTVGYLLVFQRDHRRRELEQPEASSEGELRVVAPRPKPGTDRAG
jgi:hypothetical protein